MKKILIWLLLSLFCVGCSTNHKILVSNLVDSNSKIELKSVLEQAGVSNERIEMFFDHVEQFNSCIGDESLIKGWKELSYKENTFDEYELQDIWNRQYPDYTGYNCRLTSFGLMADFIEIENLEKPDPRNIWMDKESSSIDDSIWIKEEDEKKFNALFSTINSTDSIDVSSKIEEVNKEWTKRKITIKDSPLHLVEVYMHANYGKEDQELFVGHVGIMIDLEDKGLFFIEKLAFQAPYRFIKLDSKEQLYTYLLTHYESYKGNEEADAFIMDNGNKVYFE